MSKTRKGTEEKVKTPRSLAIEEKKRGGLKYTERKNDVREAGISGQRNTGVGRGAYYTVGHHRSLKMGSHSYSQHIYSTPRLA